MTITDYLLKTRGSLPPPVRLYSTHPSSCAATSLSPRLWIVCFVVSWIVSSEFTVTSVPAKTRHLDLLLALPDSTHHSASFAGSLSLSLLWNSCRNCAVALVALTVLLFVGVHVFALCWGSLILYCDVAKTLHLDFLLALADNTHLSALFAGHPLSPLLWIFSCLVCTVTVAVLSFTGAFSQTFSANHNEVWRLDFFNMLSGSCNTHPSALFAVSLHLVSMFLIFSCLVLAVVVLFVL
jgi:hypothetical protein